MMKNILLPSLAALLAACSAVPEPVSEDQTRFELDRARFERLMVRADEELLMQELACRAQAWVAGKTNEEKNEASARCPDVAEFAMGSLGLNRSPAVAESLARLTALRLDASVAEGRACLSIRRGKEVLPFLKKLNLTHVQGECMALLLNVQGYRDYKDVKPENVCNTEADIAQIRDEFIKRIEAGEQCWPWLFD